MKAVRYIATLLTTAIAGIWLMTSLLVPLSTGAQAAEAAELDVCSTCLYTTIQSAVDAANPGDTIRVAQGTYQDIVTSPGLLTTTVLITKELTLIGGFSPDFQSNDPAVYETIVDGQNIAKGFYVSGSFAHIEGFTIINGYTQGILVRESLVNFARAGATIVNNHIHHNIYGIVHYKADMTVTSNTIADNSDSGIYGPGSAFPVSILNNTIAHNDSAGIWAITNIAITISQNEIVSNTAGGIILDYSSHFTITHNVINGNQTLSWLGGGITVDEDSSGLIAYNEIVGNEAHEFGGGIGAYSSGSVTIHHNDIRLNTALTAGGGIFVSRVHYGGPVTIEDNLISDNSAGYGGGMAVDGTSPVRIAGNEVRSNRVTREDYQAGGIDIDGTGGKVVTVVNNVIANNDSRGVKAYNFTQVDFVNNTIVANGDMGIEVFSSPGPLPDPIFATIVNNIIVGSVRCAIRELSRVTLYVDHNLFYKNSTDICGTPAEPPQANVYADPQFVDSGAGNYRLQSGSPAIDSGTIIGPYVPNVDIEGNPRPQGLSVDMGAYETSGTSWYRMFLPGVLR